MNFVLLHGTQANHTHNWFPWLKSELESMGHAVWAPDLPDADNPKVGTYNKFLLGSGYDFNGSVLIGHSSGSVEVNALLQALPPNVEAKAAVLIGTFRGDLDREDLKGMDVQFDFEKIKTKSKKFIVVHSDNDPFCPLEGAKYISDQLAADFVLLPGQGHFTYSLDKRFKEFPELLEIIKEKIL